MIRSISMPVKPRYIEELPKLERSEEREELFNSESLQSKNAQILSSDGSELNNYDLIREDSYLKRFLADARLNARREKQFQANVNLGRVIEKSGYQNISLSKIPGRPWRYFKDLMTTLIEQRWPYTFIIFLSTFFITWFVFTSLWYLIAYAHGDLNIDESSGEVLIEGKQPCVIGAQSLTALFIYTVETQVSIGFGEKYPSDECPEGVFLFVAQLIIYIGIEGAMVGIVFAKVARPSKQPAGPKFSKKAVICQRDNKLCLVIRICDQKGQQAIGTKIKLYLLEDKKTREFEHLGKCFTELQIEDSAPFILWPTTVCHYITKESPFYKYTSEDYASFDFEIIVSLAGSSPSTGQITESRTSYRPNEIVWGECFANIIHYDKSRNVYTVDYKNFNSTIPIKMTSSNPLLSSEKC